MRHRQNSRQYPRTARINELLREILADNLERIDDDRLQLLTITGIDCDGDLRRARVYYDNLDGAEGDEAVLEALAELRPRLQSAVNREATLKRTPELLFEPDPVVRSAARLEAVLRETPLRDVEVPDSYLPSADIPGVQRPDAADGVEDDGASAGDGSEAAPTIAAVPGGEPAGDGEA
jgi:ribosome-binding factor A